MKPNDWYSATAFDIFSINLKTRLSLISIPIKLELLDCMIWWNKMTKDKRKEIFKAVPDQSILGLCITQAGPKTIPILTHA